MKATIERATLLKGLSHVQSVVERRNTIPILSNVLLDARDGALRMMATDLDLQINESVAADVEQPGAITVSAHTLFDIARKLPEGSQVSLSAAEGRMTIVAGRARFSLATLPRRKDETAEEKRARKGAVKDTKVCHLMLCLADVTMAGALHTVRQHNHELKKPWSITPASR